MATDKSMCGVCADERRLWVECPKCSFKACRSCVKTYLLGLPEVTPKCMSCSVRWSYDFLAEVTDDKFHNQEYREHRAKVLMDRERSMLPETQEHVVRYIEKKKAEDEIEKLTERIKLLEAKVKALKARRHDLYARTIDIEYRNPVVSNKAKRFIGHCVMRDCKGFLEDNGKIQCGLCAQEACRDCRQKMDGEHKCNPDDVETAKLLSSTTKPCPKCSAPIFKTEGCDQMFCTLCHTAFSWRTGQLETGRIHNPHYYEFMRKQNNGVVPREQGDVVCGGLPNIRTVITKQTQLNIINSNIDKSHEVSGHIRAIELPRYRVIPNGDANRDLRIKYLVNEIDEKVWLSNLKKRDKKNEKNSSIHLILSMFVDTVDTLISNFVQATTKREGEQIVEQLLNLRVYTNEQLAKMGDKLGNKVPKISKTWRFMRYERAVEE